MEPVGYLRIHSGCWTATCLRSTEKKRPRKRLVLCCVLCCVVWSCVLCCVALRCVVWSRIVFVTSSPVYSYLILSCLINAYMYTSKQNNKEKPRIKSRKILSCANAIRIEPCFDLKATFVSFLDCERQRVVTYAHGSDSGEGKN
jgi:hypothetical protein